jgi:DNA polymerase III subunit epsilon
MRGRGSPPPLPPAVTGGYSGPMTTSIPSGPPADSLEALEALEALAAQLSASPDYLVVRRFRPRARYAEPPADGAGVRRGVFVDVETTGLGSSDSIIELAMVPFTFDRSDGRIFDVGEPLSWLEDPGRPIPAEVTQLTGITDAMVAGHRIDDDQVAAVLAKVDLVIAHNAGFDRPFLERRLPGFVDKAWACSHREVPWDRLGCGSGKLDYILFSRCAEFFDAHRASGDCLVGVHVLATSMDGERPMAMLLASARRPLRRLYAMDTPYDSRDTLKARGYRWWSGTKDLAKCWNIDVEDSAVDAEKEWLAREVYGDRQPRVVEVPNTPFTRYSTRLR